MKPPAGRSKRLAADPKYVGTKAPGFTGVLHTWGRTLEYHPHVHYVVPGGGLSDDGAQWLPSRVDFFVPVRALSKIFRAKFRDCLRRAGLLSQVDSSVWRQDWVVHSQAVGDGRASLKYLAPYVFRVAISDHRIVSCDDATATFSYRKSGSRRWRKMTVDALEFIRRLLQHVLPTGFQKVRHYGFASPNSKQTVESVRWVVTYALPVGVSVARPTGLHDAPTADSLPGLRRPGDRRCLRLPPATLCRPGTANREGCLMTRPNRSLPGGFQTPLRRRSPPLRALRHDSAIPPRFSSPPATPGESQPIDHPAIPPSATARPLNRPGA